VTIACVNETFCLPPACKLTGFAPQPLNEPVFDLDLDGV
jgi:hypothetical protein